MVKFKIFHFFYSFDKLNQNLNNGYTWKIKGNLFKKLERYDEAL